MAKVTVEEGKSAIQTPRLLLRVALESDLNDFHGFFKDEEVMRYWSTAPHENIEKTNEYLGKMLDSPCNGKLDFVLVLRSTRNVIGKLGIWRADPTNPEVGFMLARAYWGKGYMAEAMEAWLEYLWGPDCERLVRGEQEKEFGKPADRTQKGGIQAYAGARVEKVVADVDPRNDACLGMMKKFDFVETGREERTYETHLGWCDSVYLELRRPKRA